LFVQYVKSFNLPTLVLGGGGYTIKNVSRCWTNETAIICEQGQLSVAPDLSLSLSLLPYSFTNNKLADVTTEISNDLPYTDYTEYFAPDFQLHPPVTSTIENLNTRSYLESIKQTAFEQIRALAGAPAVQMHQVPTPIILDDEDDWENVCVCVRRSVACRSRENTHRT